MAIFMLYVVSIIFSLDFSKVLFFWKGLSVSAMCYDKRDFCALKAGMTVLQEYKERTGAPSVVQLSHWKAASFCPNKGSFSRSPGCS